MWDYVRYGANDFLGEVTLDLGNHPLDDEAEWYILQPHQDTSFHSVSVKSIPLLPLHHLEREFILTQIYLMNGYLI